MKGAVPVYLEIGTKRVIAGAIDWPGWARIGRTEEDALAAVVAYGPRYAKAIKRVDPSFTPPRGVDLLEIVERLEGTPTTDFGAPAVAPTLDDEPLSNDALDHQLRLLRACWETFDTSARAAAGVKLRTGPRGGGRDLAKIVDHVSGAEAVYLGALGARAPKGDVASAAKLRAAVVDAVTARARDEPLADPTRVKKRWSPRFFVRRDAWHTLDHAWEIEDRAIPAADLTQPASAGGRSPHRRDPSGTHGRRHPR